MAGCGVALRIPPGYSRGRVGARGRAAHSAGMLWVLMLLVAGTAAATAPPPAQGVIATGCAGGVTGGGVETRIVADGRIVRLTLPRAGQPWQVEQRGFDQAAYARLDRVLEASGFARLRGSPPGNMTCWLERGFADGHRLRVSWAGTDPPAAWPAPLRAAVPELRELGR